MSATTELGGLGCFSKTRTFLRREFGNSLEQNPEKGRYYSGFFIIKNEVFFFNKLIFYLIIFSTLICIFFIPTLSISNTFPEIDESKIFFYGNSNYAWPIPGYTRISSHFGKRNAPTSGASTYHKGIDIPAPEGTTLIACYNGSITFTGFLGGGGYTITLTTPENLKISYCHVSPNYIVSVGDQILQGQIIGTVGPKYVYGVAGNIYKDAEGRPTNGATTGCHLHIGFRLNGEYVNPLNYLQ